MGANATTLTATNALRIAVDNFTTATVYWAGGTLAVTNANHGSVVQIGQGTSSVGTLFVTNGTVLYDQNTPGSGVFRGLLVGNVASAGKLVISGPGVVTNSITGTATLAMNAGVGTGGSALIITNGGKLFGSGSTHVISNSLVLVSGPGSLITDLDPSNLGLAAVFYRCCRGVGQQHVDRQQRG
jgi:hypothetical protein